MNNYQNFILSDLVMTQQEITIDNIQSTLTKKTRSWDEDSPSNADENNEHLCKPLATREKYVFDANNGGGRLRRPKRDPKLKEGRLFPVQMQSSNFQELMGRE